jgi:hypothetical protein
MTGETTGGPEVPRSADTKGSDQTGTAEFTEVRLGDCVFYVEPFSYKEGRVAWILFAEQVRDAKKFSVAWTTSEMAARYLRAAVVEHVQHHPNIIFRMPAHIDGTRPITNQQETEKNEQ